MALNILLHGADVMLHLGHLGFEALNFGPEFAPNLGDLGPQLFSGPLNFIPDFEEDLSRYLNYFGYVVFLKESYSGTGRCPAGRARKLRTYPWRDHGPERKKNGTSSCQDGPSRPY